MEESNRVFLLQDNKSIEREKLLGSLASMSIKTKCLCLGWKIKVYIQPIVAIAKLHTMLLYRSEHVLQYTPIELQICTTGKKHKALNSIYSQFINIFFFSKIYDLIQFLFTFLHQNCNFFSFLLDFGLCVIMFLYYAVVWL